MDLNKVEEVAPNEYRWVDTFGITVTATGEEIAASAKKANDEPHLGVYRWTRSNGTFRANAEVK